MTPTREDKTASEKSRREPNEDARRRGVIRKALKASSYSPIARLDCDVADDTAILSGVVPSYYQKQLAQAIVMRLKVVDRIENRVLVRLP